MRQLVFGLIAGLILIFCSSDIMAQFSGPYKTPYYIEGSSYGMEEEPGFVYDGMFFYVLDYAKREVSLSTYTIYDDDEPGQGGVYWGELDVPSTMYNEDFGIEYTVTGVDALFRNGVTVLRLPETIRRCNTIEKCRLLREVYLNDNLKEFGGIVDCPRLTVCPLPSALEYVSHNSMCGLGLKKIEFPPLLRAIGDKSFCRNYELEYLDLENLEVIGDSCFNVLPNLREITLPESLQTMGKSSFRYCYMVETLNLPSHEIDIDVFSFGECKLIKTVTVAAEIPYKMPYFLKYQLYDITLYVPDGSEEAYRNADGWKNFKILPISQKSEVNEVQASQPKGWRVSGSKGQITVSSDTDRHINVVNMEGKTMARIRKSGSTAIPLPAGVYTVACNGQSTKVIVK